MSPAPDAAARHRIALVERLVFGEAAGSFVVAGVPPPDLLAALAAVASGVTLLARGRRARDATRWLEAVGPLWTQTVPPGGDGLPAIEETHHNAFVWELPRSDRVAALERVLFAVADEGTVLLSVERHRSSDGRLERLLRSACTLDPAIALEAPPERLALEGRRRAPYPVDLTEDAPEPLPVDVVVVTRGREDGIFELLLDLFLRQNHPPRTVFVMDVGGDAPLPEDLFGLPAQSAARAVLVPAPGTDAATAVNDALSGTEAPFVALLRPGVRLAPNHLAALGLALEADEELGAVVGVRLEDGVGGSPRLVSPPACRPREWLRPLLEGAVPALEATLFRTGVLRALQGLDPARGDAAVLDLWFRLAAVAGLGTAAVPVVLGRGTGPGAVPGPGALAWLRSEVSPARLGAAWPELPSGARELRALLARSAAARRLGDAAAAEEDAREARRRAPGDPEARDAWLGAALDAGAWARVRDEATAMIAADPEAAAPRLARARASLRTGAASRARADLEAVLAHDPGHRGARFGLLLLHLARDPAGLALAAPLGAPGEGPGVAGDPALQLGIDDLEA